MSRQEYVVKLPPHIDSLPLDWIIIDYFNNDFYLSVKHMKEQDSIGVSLEGPEISRSGILTWLCVSTSSCTFLFDILTLGEEAFRRGIKSVLEHSGIQKIFHDCRMASDCLYHQYGVLLDNVFDTQAADNLVMLQQNDNHEFVQEVNSLNECLNYYLKVPSEYLYESLFFDRNEQSIHYYENRPLCHELQDLMIKNVIYLRLLQREIECELFNPLRRMTDQFLNAILSKDDRELLACPPNLDELPPEVLLDGLEVVNFQEPDEMSIVSWNP
ncbi:piRNA biogenesis protein EXD1 [Trichonephila inaurata madagascariensis]|uniref:PiRNA biogenesis protein EXD1 n=1 Tax=Trichonephila inaurata madagascariensis TaxID=2747483 RepID=A0A8X6YAW7_9ARAC|nr:piRNA biogenesis protein EXD1 [Trichonephila inaurata madagascariensis]